ncbi:RPAP1-like protein [Mya arenaria]|uniref:RPAP1-like protein n=1 Tax=Mya arenaria TaxID=6604 RepID=A0ABY7FEG9_MYAAR|nr:RPAP1-like protein [Mya arenaria]
MLTLPVCINVETLLRKKTEAEVKMLKRPKPGEDEAELLEFQRQFLAQGASPAANLVKKTPQGQTDRDVVKIQEMPAEAPSSIHEHPPVKKSRFKATRPEKDTRNAHFSVPAHVSLPFPAMAKLSDDKNKEPLKRKRSLFAQQFNKTSLPTPLERDSLGKAEDKMEPPIEVDSNWVHMGSVEHDKLAWMKDLPTPSAGHSQTGTQARFDFDGNLLPPDADIPVNLGLHHHGDEPERAGYTLEELFTLSRSSNNQQRVLALNILAKIITQAKQGCLSELVQSPVLPSILDAGVVFLLRWSLDDSVDAVMAAAVAALNALIVNHADELMNQKGLVDLVIKEFFPVSGAAKDAYPKFAEELRSSLILEDVRSHDQLSALIGCLEMAVATATAQHKKHGFRRDVETMDEASVAETGPSLNWAHVTDLAQPISLIMQSQLTHIATNYQISKPSLQLCQSCLNFLTTYFICAQNQVSVASVIQCPDMWSYARKIVQSGSAAPSYFTKFETHLLYFFIKINMLLLTSEDFVSFDRLVLHHLSLTLITSLQYGDEYLIHDLLSTVTFSQQLCKRSSEEIAASGLKDMSVSDQPSTCLHVVSKDEAQLTSARLSEEACSCLPSVRASYMEAFADMEGAVMKSRSHFFQGNIETLTCYTSSIGESLMPQDWVYMPLIELYNQYSTVGLEVQNALSACQLDMVRNVLRWVFLLECNRTARLENVPITLKISRIMYVALLEQFEAVSFGDSLFACFLLIPVQQKHDLKYRRAIWTEYTGILRTLSLPLNETCVEIVRLYFQSVYSGKLRPTWSPVLYLVAIHHINRFMYTQDGKHTHLKATMMEKALTCSNQELSHHLVHYKNADLTQPFGMELYTELPAIRQKYIDSLKPQHS